MKKNKPHGPLKPVSKPVLSKPDAAPDALPPHSLEDEQAALGCVLLAAESFEGSAESRRLLEQIKSQMFYDLRHRQILRAMNELAAAGHAIDSLLVSKWMEAHEVQKELWATIGYLNSCIKAVPSVFNFPSYLDNLTDKARRRSLILLASRAAQLANDASLDPAVLRQEFAEQLDAVSAAGVGKNVLQIVTHKEINAYVPPPNLCLLGENHINRGGITIFAGPPGCGKSRLATTLAVAGAKGKGKWMGFDVHCKFRTLIIQAENGLYRLKQEFEAVPPFAEESIRVSAPPPGGLAFHKPDFRAALKAELRDHPVELIVIDPFNRVAAEEGQSDYIEAIQNILTVLPQGEAMPAIVIVAHMRKPKTEGMGSGRSMIHEVSGSLALSSVARAMFFLLPGSDDVQDDTVVFLCRKNNDGKFGEDTAWQRCNGEFKPRPDFDFAEFWNPPKNGQRVITPDLLEEILQGGKRALTKNTLASEIMERGKFGKSAAYGAIERLADYLTKKDGLLSWKKV